MIYYGAILCRIRRATLIVHIQKKALIVYILIHVKSELIPETDLGLNKLLVLLRKYIRYKNAFV